MGTNGFKLRVVLHSISEFIEFIEFIETGDELIIGMSETNFHWKNHALHKDDILFCQYIQLHAKIQIAQQ